MNKANECTCPSGDGSLVHPCPAHPAVEQAGGDERAAFEAAFAAMGRPVCRADYDQDAYGTPFDDGGWTGWQARAALAQPSPAQAEQAEAGRSEVERLREENANLILACASLDSEKREMRHKWDAIIAMRDAALARVEELELKLDKSDYAYDNDRIHMRGLAARAIARAKVFDDGSDGADAESARSVVAILRELLAVGPAQAQQSVPELEPVDGDVLPKIGSTVLIHLARQDEWVEHTVVGYYAWADLGGNDRLHRLFVRVRDRDGYLNVRLLKDVRTPDRLAAAPGKEVGHE
ncbi:hypothetical protein ACGHBB_000509 [Pseudomonas aeruginosa]